jgi:hypothetical protein
MKKISDINFKELGNKISLLWNKYYKLVLVIFFLIISLWGAYSWRWYLYKFKWDSEKINQYISSHDQEVKFKEENFKKVISEIERRKNAYSESAKSVKDVMGPLKSPNQ